MGKVIARRVCFTSRASGAPWRMVNSNKIPVTGSILGFCPATMSQFGKGHCRQSSCRYSFPECNFASPAEYLDFIQILLRLVRLRIDQKFMLREVRRVGKRWWESAVTPVYPNLLRRPLGIVGLVQFHL